MISPKTVPLCVSAVGYLSLKECNEEGTVNLDDLKTPSCMPSQRQLPFLCTRPGKHFANWKITMFDR